MSTDGVNETLTAEAVGQLFDTIDIDKNGSINLAQWTTELPKLKIPGIDWNIGHPEVARFLFSSIDISNCKYVTREQVIEFATAAPPPNSQLVLDTMFRGLDTERKGYITCTQLIVFFRFVVIASGYGDDEYSQLVTLTEAIFSGMDIDKRGVITKEQFFEFARAFGICDGQQSQEWIGKMLFRYFDSDRKRFIDLSKLKAQLVRWTPNGDNSVEAFSARLLEVIGRSDGFISYAQYVKVRDNRDIPEDTDVYDGKLPVRRLVLHNRYGNWRRRPT
jgi:Ca2+-binding EF-hand superfamily protein